MLSDGEGSGGHYSLRAPMSPRAALVTPAEFRARFNDMRPGFVAWVPRAADVTVVSCEVYDTSRHEGAWLAAAAENRRAATSILKSFGVHGFKFDQAPFRGTPETLITAAITSRRHVVALLPDEQVLVFP